MKSTVEEFVMQTSFSAKIGMLQFWVALFISIKQYRTPYFGRMLSES